MRMHNTLRPLWDRSFSVTNDDNLEFALQGSSHIDSFAHFGAIEPGQEGVYYSGAPLTETYPQQSAKRLGIDAYGGSIVTRGVLLDILGFVLGPTAPYLPDDFRITGAVIRDCISHQGVTLESGDAVLIFTGFEMRREAEGGRVPPASAGVDGSTLSVWEQAKISLLAADNPGVEIMPVDYSIHVGALRNLGIPLGELWALRRLAESCRADANWDFLLVAVPLNLRGAFGSPANAVAIR
jgi:hypothetical protein